MKPMSLKKLAGLSFCIGAVLITIPFLLQITAGGTPEEGTLIWRHFSNSIVEGGSLSLLFPLMSVTGIAFLMRYYIILRAGAVFFSYVAFIIPMFGIFFGVLFLDETLSLSTIVAVLLILSGVYLGRK